MYSNYKILSELGALYHSSHCWVPENMKQGWMDAVPSVQIVLIIITSLRSSLLSLYVLVLADEKRNNSFLFLCPPPIWMLISLPFHRLQRGISLSPNIFWITLKCLLTIVKLNWQVCFKSSLDSHLRRQLGLWQIKWWIHLFEGHCPHKALTLGVIVCFETSSVKILVDSYLFSFHMLLWFFSLTVVAVQVTVEMRHRGKRESGVRVERCQVPREQRGESMRRDTSCLQVEAELCCWVCFGLGPLHLVTRVGNDHHSTQSLHRWH